MEKERLTKEWILQDIRHSRKHYKQIKERWAEHFCPAFGLFLIALLFYITWSPYVWLLLLIPAGYYLTRFIRKNRKANSFSEEDFYVSTDRLASVQETFVYVDRGNRRKKVVLLFEGGGEWEVPYDNYVWSESWKMSRQSVENTSLQGDTFYLARFNGTGTVAVAYNSNFFSYSDIL